VVFLWGASETPELIAPTLTGVYDDHGYILVVPEGGPHYPLTWDMDPAGADDDLRFYDDVLACLDQQFPVDRRRIHSVGFSVGGCFSAYLMGHRSETLASFVSYSGGDQTPAGERLVPMPHHPIPGLLFHGGDTDNLWAGKPATLSLASRMVANDQFTIVCDHGRGHKLPGPVRDMWDFMLAHPFSPGNTAAWAQTGIADKLPAFCEVR
jgi:poly(3-hydroxybutyrate) depolymerase